MPRSKHLNKASEDVIETSKKLKKQQKSWKTIVVKIKID